MTTRRKIYGVKDLERRFGKLTLGRFLASWRKAESLTQREFADKLGLSAANLCDIEKGRKGVSIYKAAEIAGIIGYSPTLLVELALQEQVDTLGLKWTVQVRKGA